MIHFEKINTDEIRFTLIHEIKYFNEYFSFNENMIIKRNVELEQLLKIDIQENERDENLYRNIYDFDSLKLSSYFYHSSLVSLYSLLEKNLNQICDQVKKDVGFNIGLEDFAGQNIIKTSKVYLAKLVKIDFDKIDKEWIEITNYQKIRNLIVHQNSQLKSIETNHENQKLIRSFDIEIDNATHNFYIRNRIVIDKFLKIIEKFIFEILDQLSKKEIKNIEFKEDDSSPFGITF